MAFTLEHRIQALGTLGTLLEEISAEEHESLLRKVWGNNPWFVPQQAILSIQGIKAFLDTDKLSKWTSSYSINLPSQPKSIGLVLAGNIPGVGFHDLLCVLVSGHKAHIKLSSTDSVLIPWLIDKLITIEPQFAKQVNWAERLQGMDAYIATGSNNSARYFHYYFGQYPHIIRKNRSSVAILDGKETTSDLERLSTDVLQYFGLGCRNVSKIFVSDYQQVMDFLKASDSMKQVMDHHKYANNYDYNKSIYLVNNEPHLDNGFLLMRESNEWVSPISVVHYSYYTDPASLSETFQTASDNIQCSVSRNGWFPGSLEFGTTQCPGLSDYADNMDTLEFLLSLT
ncbi:MAG: acyl-CoA reductase [Lunatimonas sp.]|uniref:acyl-CoA reductase n=1 Tax=Lunatimonas sp. TaxID=2060141 RepID=UPI00263A98AD|nr:acyl-CoA reductase [Lunatimonas sp.]MCC5938537.1 acyl-CoA reductase [Lunatimonas sp.]